MGAHWGSSARCTPQASASAWGPGKNPDQNPGPNLDPDRNLGPASTPLTSSAYHGPSQQQLRRCCCYGLGRDWNPDLDPPTSCALPCADAATSSPAEGGQPDLPPPPQTQIQQAERGQPTPPPEQNQAQLRRT